ncbi:cofilin/tropomyosin-type actin-binding protein domain-containing protein [Phthorimaea operculella]|nr:cofilin/tropomyosin-type actin-binding protein domain-containing protein [Phthorimaea operculella]
MEEAAIHAEGIYTSLQNEIDKIAAAQSSVLSKFDSLCNNVEELKTLVTLFGEKVTALEEVATDRRRLKTEIKVLKNRIDELYTIVKDGKEDDSTPSIGSQDHDVESTHSGFSCSSKVAMTTGIDRDTIRSAYEDVRSDTSPTEWAVFKFEGARIVCAARGSDFTEFRTHFADDERAFGYLRLQMGDEMSKRKKFMFVTWVGPNVSVINRAKMSTDKAIIKDIISDIQKELTTTLGYEADYDTTCVPANVPTVAARTWSTVSIAPYALTKPVELKRMEAAPQGEANMAGSLMAAANSPSGTTTTKKRKPRRRRRRTSPSPTRKWKHRASHVKSHPRVRWYPTGYISGGEAETQTGLKTRELTSSRLSREQKGPDQCNLDPSLRSRSRSARGRTRPLTSPPAPDPVIRRGHGRQDQLEALGPR